MCDHPQKETATPVRQFIETNGWDCEGCDDCKPGHVCPISLIADTCTSKMTLQRLGENSCALIVTDQNDIRILTDVEGNS